MTKPKLPDNFLGLKREFEKVMKRYYYNKEKTEESQTLLFLMLSEYNEYVEQKLLEVGQEIFLDMKKKEEFVQYLDKYGKKIYYNEEAGWMDVDDMTSDDYAITAKRDNAKYLNKEG